ncbi:unnamed protein product [Hydatigera taeniaeformis]|uniref:TYR_PHOSPHATASE_2 domain-containing protein n=1 Tax=Hydatigena taeniaeformis TaxID=6205 RepID=A0A0R3XCA6_HYDTA|nr:unnamed protein product [Hydatigera taeniaeformis]
MPRYPPPRWLDYSPLGTHLSGTSLLPVKLPIPKEYSSNIPREHWFTDNDLLNFCSDMNLPLVCIIDLTYTDYYDPKLFIDRGVKYVKVYVEGHLIPNPTTVKRFMEILRSVTEDFPGTMTMSKRSYVGGTIAVHCTHGVNRTGYLICRYLIDVLGWSADEAIEVFFNPSSTPLGGFAVSEFARARGHAIERRNYVNDLRHR